MLIRKLKASNGKPGSVWKILETLKNQEKKDPKDAISPEVWYEYYKRMYSNKNEDENDFVQQLMILESVKVFNKLDYIITQDEIRRAIIISLKNKKAQGLDIISNELLNVYKLCLFLI